jgi:hypothetical protein
MLQASHRDLPRIESLSMVPKNLRNSDGMFGAYRPRKSGEVVVRGIIILIITATWLLVHGKWSMQQDQCCVILLMKQEE